MIGPRGHIITSYLRVGWGAGVVGGDPRGHIITSYLWLGWGGGVGAWGGWGSNGMIGPRGHVITSYLRVGGVGWGGVSTWIG